MAGKKMAPKKLKKRMGKISLLMILASLVIATSISIFDFFSEKNKLETRFHNSIAPIPGRIANIIQKPLWFMDKEQGVNTLMTEMQDKRIFAVLAKETNGKLFVGKQRGDDWNIIDSKGKLQKENFQLIEKPVQYDGKTIGSLEVYFTERFINEELNKMILVMSVKAILMTGLLVGFLLIIVQFYLIKPILNVARGIEDSKKMIRSFSQRVMENSDDLSINASDQAAMVQETASSLEEMSSMTHQTAANVRQSNQLMKKALSMVSATRGSMGKFMDAMKDITDTSEKTSRIVKTIEDIAFQTNLLSLNAAVEAAHAGDSGAGFAVVADEVRNLANRSSTAAKNTAELIGASVEKIRKGEKIAESFREVFENLEKISNETKELLAQIDASSNEQAEGIHMISTAMAKIDQSTQSNMERVEKTVASIQETRYQVKRMSEFVEALSGLIGVNIEKIENGIVPRKKPPGNMIESGFDSPKLIS